MTESDYEFIKRALFTLKEHSDAEEKRASELEDKYAANCACLLAISAIERLRRYQPAIKQHQDVCADCGHAEHGNNRCLDRAPNPQFRCCCRGPHGYG